jgi:hypothetical protein
MVDSLASFNPNGTLSVSDRAYVERPFETQIWSHLTAKRWVSLLGPRKYGKSSALVRIRDRLMAGGFACAFIDLQSYGRSRNNYADFLEWFAETVASEVGASFAAPRKRNRTALDAWLQAVTSREFQNTAILIDEASGVPAEFRTTFFGQLRAFHGLRGRGGSNGHLARRVDFAFSGTFRPARLITGSNSPFNVSEEVNPDDLTFDQVTELGRLGLGDDAKQFAQQAFDETRGQPFYVQHLFAAVQTAEEDRQVAFDAALERLRTTAFGNLEHLTTLINADAELRLLVPKILEGTLEFHGANPIHQYAVVSGIARNSDGQLVPRNPIHARALEQLGDQDRPVIQFP